MSDKAWPNRDAYVPSIVVFTRKGIDTMLRDGGSQSWRVRRNHARRASWWYAPGTRTTQKLKDQSYIAPRF